ncbi:hypothetical protein [Haloarcula montana]|uniref:hypothetical protein n=1 Tax=Haloarcula montana TaxID=3111776 RepID=UPI002D77B4C4|nr:hypothetical protein [Haloarcula sp. GH36]
MNRPLLAVGLVVLVGLAGCSTLSGAGQPATDGGVELEDNRTGATGVTQSIAIEVTDARAGEELTEIGATYPRDRFVVDSAQHEAVAVGVDTDGDGEIEEAFDESHVSGVNNNAFSFDITLDTGYTLQSGDTVMIEYPTVSNPTEPGEYTVETRLNGQQAGNATVSIE